MLPEQGWDVVGGLVADEEGELHPKVQATPGFELGLHIYWTGAHGYRASTHETTVLGVTPQKGWEYRSVVRIFSGDYPELTPPIQFDTLMAGPERSKVFGYF